MLKFDPHQINLYQPPANSHKGQNGKLLVIGGSKLFHSSIFWAADVASRIVDIVHFTSPANENNELVRRKIKQNFWSGIVVDWTDVENYIEEDDCVLIGPGMVRREADQGLRDKGQGLREATEKDDTAFIVNYFLKKYPSRRWVIDGGGLQEVEPELLNANCIITPHKQEFEGLLKRSDLGFAQGRTLSDTSRCAGLSKYLNDCTILLKGPTDTVCQADRCVEIVGGNPGMTKGGTGDVLAGLVAALYCKNDAWTAATISSWVNKRAGDNLYAKVGPYFDAADLVKEVPPVLFSLDNRQM